MKEHTIGIIVEGRIETWSIWGNCPWPTRYFPFGFEFSFVSLLFRQLEECEVASDNGLTILNPDVKDNPYVLVRVNHPEFLPAAVKQQIDEGEIQVSLNKCQDWLGLSHWKLIDLLHEQQEDKLKHQISLQLDARDYHTITMMVHDGKYTEKRETAPQ